MFSLGGIPIYYQDKLEAFSQGFPRKPMNCTAEYAVFVPFMEKEGDVFLLYQVRSKTMRRQPSEICFPGGRMEQGETATQAAVRELQEELGISPLKIYGETDFLVQRTGAVIYPVMGLISPDSTMTLCNKEVDSVFTVPVSHLLSQKEEYSVLLQPIPQFQKEDLSLKEEYPFRCGEETFGVYRVGEHIIWGITGSITRYILSLL